MLEIKDLSISFQRRIFNNASVCFHSRQLISIKGESGSGKSTLLKFIMNEVNGEGQLFYNNMLIDANSRDSFLFSHISYIDQLGSYFPNMTMKQHFEFYAKLHELEFTDEKIKEYFDYVFLECSNYKKSPSQLSTGERKRFLIALALFLHKDIILLDEPSASLDRKSESQLLETLKKIKENNVTIIMTTHDDDLLEASDAIYEIKDCQIVEVKKDISCEKNKTFEEKIPHKIKYRKYKNLRLKIVYLIVFLIGCISIVFISQTVSLTASISNIQTQELDFYRNNSLYFAKISQYDGYEDTVNFFDFDSDNMDIINQKDLDFIKGVDGVIDVKPFVALQQLNQESLIEIVNNDKVMKEVKPVTYHNWDWDPDAPLKHYVYVIGYYPEDHINQDNNKIYIDELMQKIINIDSYENLFLKLNMNYISHYDVDENNIHSREESKQVEIPIDGVLSLKDFNDVISDDIAKIYMPIDKLEDLISEYYGNINRQYRRYIIYCEENKDEDIKLTIEEENDLYITKNDKLSEKEMIDYIRRQNNNSKTSAFIISAVLFAGMILLITYNQILRKKEILLLKRAGLQKEILGYYKEDICDIGMLWFIISMIALAIYKRMIVYMNISEIWLIGSWIVVTVFIIIIAYIVNRYAVKKMIVSVIKND